MQKAFEKTLPLKERETIRKKKMEAERAKKEEEKARKAAEKAKAEEVSLTSAFSAAFLALRLLFSAAACIHVFPESVVQ
jgi:hypothetical protein